jgi:GH15 family glucan-1,4-alpha-glucosidase
VSEDNEENRGDATHRLLDQPTTWDRRTPIRDYALIGDCHGSALVSTSGSIDWCCMPRFDSGSCFGALLDPDIGGRWLITPEVEYTTSRRYLEDTMVLETVFQTDDGVLRLTDCMVADGNGAPHRIVRKLEGVVGTVPVAVVISPRLAYGALKPWIRQLDSGAFTVIGGDTGLIVSAGMPLHLEDRHDLLGSLVIGEGDRHLISMAYAPPEKLDPEPSGTILQGDDEERLQGTIDWWRSWVDGRKTPRGGTDAARSALILKALSYTPTGAFVAAATTSLPESPGGERNWDYRYSWVRDSTFAARALIEIGFDDAATGFRRFTERSAAGSAADLQPMYGVGGEIRLPEIELDYLSGYGGSRPVRIGNAAFPQRQSDLYGYLLDLAWRWQRAGVDPSPAYWPFLMDLVELACERWQEPDRGIWEVRGDPLHFVHSKVMCWSAVDCGIRLAEKLGFEAPLEHWKETRATIEDSILTRGYEQNRGIFVRSYDSGEVDAALLLLPWVGFVEFDDERMVRTADEIRKTLSHRGLIRRYVARDGLDDTEGTFVACTFWLAECLARQGRAEEARSAMEAAVATGNDLGLFSEEYDPAHTEMLGNFPQAMSHFAHITALCAVEEASGAQSSS